jgi:hypothetical protein
MAGKPETSKEHWERMKRWAKEDAAERDAGRLLPMEKRPRIIVSRTTSEERAKQEEWELLFGKSPSAGGILRAKEPSSASYDPAPLPGPLDGMSRCREPSRLPPMSRDSWSIGCTVVCLREWSQERSRMIFSRRCAGSYRVKGGDSIRVSFSARPPTQTATVAAFFTTRAG